MLNQYSNRKAGHENNQAKAKNKYTFTSVCVCECVCECVCIMCVGVCVCIQNIDSFRILSNLLNSCCGQTIDL